MAEIQLSGFELIEKIGEGGLGQVWKARQLSLDRIVAIKLLPARASSDPENLRQLIQEARTTAKLKHPGIVQVYDSSEQDGSFFFVMEYVAGYNVGQWLSRKKVLSHKDALVVVESVASALDYAWHTAGLIHCDIKPENIMVDQDGTIKVADLGLSVTQDTQSSKPADEVAGTPGYISPEQVLGTEKLDCRTDIYALGCCLYQMVTGKRPFCELPDHDALEAQVTSTIKDPRDWVPGIPAPVCGLIERMLVKKRDKRLKDWAAVLAEVHRVQKGLMPSSPAPEMGASTMQRRTMTVASAKSNGGDRANTAPAPKSGGWGWGAVIILTAVVGAMWFQLRKPATSTDVVLSRTKTSPVTNVPAHTAKSQLSSRAGSRQDVAAGAELVAAQGEIRRVVANYVANGALAEAIGWLEGYRGTCGEETRSNRMEIVKSLRRKIADQEQAKTEEQDWQGMGKDLATGILAGKYVAMRQAADAASKDPKFRNHQAALASIAKTLGDMAGLSDKVLESFSKDVGNVVTIQLRRGVTSGRVMDVKDHRVMLTTAEGMGQLEIRVEDMAMSQRLSRLETVNLPEAYLIRGVTAYNNQRIEDAAALLAKTGPGLAPFLLRAIKPDPSNDGQAVEVADEGLKAFGRMLKDAGVSTEGYDPAAWRKTLADIPMSRDTAVSLDRALESYLAAYGNSAFVSANPQLIMEVQAACGKVLEQNNATGGGSP